MAKRASWQAARAVFVLVWLGLAGLSWWTHPTEVDAATARADLTGRELPFSWGDKWDNLNDDWVLAPSLRQRGGDTDTILAWRLDDWRVRYVDPAGPELAPLVAGREPGNPVDGPDRFLGYAVGIGLILAALLVVRYAPDPVVGTRVYWFWWLWLAPYGTGILYWLAVERPWARREPPPKTRLPGIFGFLIALVLALAVSVIL